MKRSIGSIRWMALALLLFGAAWAGAEEMMAPPGGPCTNVRSKSDELRRPSRRLAAQGSSGTRQFSVFLRRAPKGPVSKGTENSLPL